MQRQLGGIWRRGAHRGRQGEGGAVHLENVTEFWGANFKGGSLMIEEQVS